MTLVGSLLVVAYVIIGVFVGTAFIRGLNHFADGGFDDDPALCAMLGQIWPALIAIVVSGFVLWQLGRFAAWVLPGRSESRGSVE